MKDGKKVSIKLQMEKLVKYLVRSILVAKLKNMWMIFFKKEIMKPLLWNWMKQLRLSLGMCDQEML